MSSIKGFIYQTGIKLIPSNKIILQLIKWLKIPNNKFYKDLSFRGPFKVNFGHEQSFLMEHHGGIIENETFWKGLFKTFESDTGWIWMQLSPKSDVIFDIGANTGIYSLVAKTLNPNSYVYAFEPSMHTYSRLVNNNSINGFDIECEQLAISDKNTSQIFYDVPNANQMSASLSPDKLKNWEGYSGESLEYVVETVTLSNYIETHDINRIDLMKIDIELHEPEAIQGLGLYLQKFKPVILIEVLTESVAEQLNNLIDLEQHFIFHLEGENRATRKKDFSVVNGLWNFLVFHRDRADFIQTHTSIDISH